MNLKILFIRDEPKDLPYFFKFFLLLLKEDMVSFDSSMKMK